LHPAQRANARRAPRRQRHREFARLRLRRAEAERWLLIYEHDATTAWTRVRHDGKAYVTDAD